MLIERDPHQIIEGAAIAAYATGADQAFIYCRGEFALGLERLQQACNEAYEHGALGADVLRERLLPRRRDPPGRRRLHLRRGDGAVGEPGGKTRLSPHQAAVLPRRRRPLRRADRREQRGDDVQPALDPDQRRRGLRRPRRGLARPGRGCSPSRAGSCNPGWFEIEMAKTTFRDLIFDPAARRAASPRASSCRPSSPAGSRRRGSVRTSSTSVSTRTPSARPARCSARAPSSCWTPTPARACGLADRPVLPPGVVRPVHALPGGQRLAREDHAEHGAGRRPLRRTSTSLLDACDNLAPGLAWPPKQTTICVLGPSIPSSVVSVARMFRDDMLVHVKEGGCPFPADGGRRG